MPLSVGDRLSRYEIRGFLGAGGMGEVYRALDTRLDREVAIKVLPQELTHDTDRLRRFEREARGPLLSTIPTSSTCTISASIRGVRSSSPNSSRGIRFAR